MTEKLFISPESLYSDSLVLARQVYDSGFRPDFIVGLWRGGCAPGSVVHDAFSYWGCKADHIAIRTSRYEGIERAGVTTHVHGLGYIVDRINADDSLLIVDDVFDSGITIRDVLNELKSRSRRNAPRNIKVATVYFKPTRNKTDIVPDFWINETDRWIVFPHEFEGLTAEEILAGKGSEIADLLNLSK